MDALIELTTADAVIDALGGTGEVQKLTGRKYPQSVSNWRKGTLPPDTFIVVTEELRKRGKTAPAWLFGMAERPERAA